MRRIRSDVFGLEDVLGIGEVHYLLFEYVRELFSCLASGVVEARPADRLVALLSSNQLDFLRFDCSSGEGCLSAALNAHCG
jgi:hypothetical protein